MNLLMRSLANLVKGKIASTDGKILRGSSCNSSAQKAIYMVSAWANENQLLLVQIRIEEKSSEITAIPKLLELLEIVESVLFKLWLMFKTMLHIIANTALYSKKSNIKLCLPYVYRNNYLP